MLLIKRFRMQHAYYENLAGWLAFTYIYVSSLTVIEYIAQPKSFYKRFRAKLLLILLLQYKQEFISPSISLKANIACTKLP